MLRIFFLLMFRNFFRQKFYSTINIIGLSVGITASILILLFIVDELSFDRMHTKSDRIFRVVEKRIAADKEYKIPMTIERLGDFKVTAVLINLSKNSHLDFEMLLPLSVLQMPKAWNEWKEVRKLESGRFWEHQFLQS